MNPSSNNPTNLETLRLHLAAEAAHDAAAAAATYLEDGWYENAALGVRFEGRDQVEFQYAASYDFIEGMDASYEWELEVGDTVVQVGRIRGRARGPLMGVGTRGGELDFRFVAVISFRDGRMSGEHIWYDLGEFCEQAGADLDAVRQALAASAGH